MKLDIGILPVSASVQTTMTVDEYRQRITDGKCCISLTTDAELLSVLISGVPQPNSVEEEEQDWFPVEEL